MSISAGNLARCLPKSDFFGFINDGFCKNFGTGDNSITILPERSNFATFSNLVILKNLFALVKNRFLPLILPEKDWYDLQNSSFHVF